MIQKSKLLILTRWTTFMFIIFSFEIIFIYPFVSKETIKASGSTAIYNCHSPAVVDFAKRQASDFNSLTYGIVTGGVHMSGTQSH
jgi:hypothetical protein